MSEPLRLVTKEPEPYRDPRTALIMAWGSWLFRVTGRNLPKSAWGMMMKTLSRRFLGQLDEVTGEILDGCYPDIEEWQEQLEGFFTNNDWSRQQGYPWLVFIGKQYGHYFPKPKPKGKQSQKVRYHCDKCKQMHEVGSKEESECAKL